MPDDNDDSQYWIIASQNLTEQMLKLLVSARPDDAASLVPAASTKSGPPAPYSPQSTPEPVPETNDREDAIHAYIREALRVSYLNRRRAFNQRAMNKHDWMTPERAWQDPIDDFEAAMAQSPEKRDLWRDFDLKPSTKRAFLRFLCRRLSAPMPSFIEQKFIRDFSSLVGYFFLRAGISLDALLKLGPPTPPSSRKAD